MYSPSIGLPFRPFGLISGSTHCRTVGAFAPYVLVVFLIPDRHHFILQVFQIGFDIFDIAG